MNALTSSYIGKGEVLVTSLFFRNVSPVPDQNVQPQHSRYTFQNRNRLSYQGNGTRISKTKGYYAPFHRQYH